MKYQRLRRGELRRITGLGFERGRFVTTRTATTGALIGGCCESPLHKSGKWQPQKAPCHTGPQPLGHQRPDGVSEACRHQDRYHGRLKVHRARYSQVLNHKVTR